MAFLQENDEEVQAQTGGPLTLQSSNATSQPTQGAGVRVNRGGGQFSDISRYISQNAPQAKRLASNVGSGIVKQGQESEAKIRENLNKAQGGFNQALTQGTPQFDQNLINQATSDPTSLVKKEVSAKRESEISPPNRPKHYQKWMDTVEGKTGLKVHADPYVQQLYNAQAADPAQFDALSAMRNAMYQGPAGLEGQEGYDAARSELQRALSASSNANTPEGFSRILRPRGSAGKLDQALLSGTGSPGILQSAA